MAGYWSFPVRLISRRSKMNIRANRVFHTRILSKFFETGTKSVLIWILGLYNDSSRRVSRYITRSRIIKNT